MAPNGTGKFFLANPDLADILGRKDLDFENFHFGGFQISGFPGSQICKIWPGPGLGLGPGGPSGGPLQLEMLQNMKEGIPVSEESGLVIGDQEEVWPDTVIGIGVRCI